MRQRGFCLYISRKRSVMNRSIWDTTLMRRLSALDTIYLRVDQSQAEFRGKAEKNGNSIACPPRCGSCCLHFVPDATPIEAEKLAFFLLTEKPEMIDHFFSRREESAAIDAACPFWDQDKPGQNCMVYPSRPLICRLFGFCSVVDKRGEPAFALCRQMPALESCEARSFTGKEVMDETFGAIPPPMVDFSRAIAALDPCDSGQRFKITEALPPALAKVSLVLGLAAASAGSGATESDTDDFMAAG